MPDRKWWSLLRILTFSRELNQFFLFPDNFWTLGGMMECKSALENSEVLNLCLLMEILFVFPWIYCFEFESVVSNCLLWQQQLEIWTHSHQQSVKYGHCCRGKIVKQRVKWLPDRLERMLKILSDWPPWLSHGNLLLKLLKVGPI